MSLSRGMTEGDCCTVETCLPTCYNLKKQMFYSLYFTALLYIVPFLKSIVCCIVRGAWQNYAVTVLHLTQKSASKCPRMCMWKTAFKGINQICNIYFYYTWKQLTWNITLCTFKCIHYDQLSSLNTLNWSDVWTQTCRWRSRDPPLVDDACILTSRLFVLSQSFTDDRCCSSGCSGCSVISWQAFCKSLSNYAFTTVALGDLFTL